MKTLLSTLLVCVAAGCCFPDKPRSVGDRPAKNVLPDLFSPHTNPPPPYQFSSLLSGGTNQVIVLFPPADRLNEVGTHAVFSVLATNIGAPITYQWYKWTNLLITNRVEISYATNDTLHLTNVQFADVAGYEVVLSQAGVAKTNLMANLSVQKVEQGSLQGTVESPVTAFGPDWWHCHETSTMFDRSYTPYDSGRPTVFYGPFVPISLQFHPIVNSSYRYWVTVSTESSAGLNYPADTAVRLINAADYAEPPQAVSDLHKDLSYSPSTDAGARITHYLGISSDRNVAGYRFILYYRNTPASGKITWTWKYHY